MIPLTSSFLIDAVRVLSTNCTTYYPSDSASQPDPSNLKSCPLSKSLLLDADLLSNPLLLGSDTTISAIHLALRQISPNPQVISGRVGAYRTTSTQRFVERNTTSTRISEPSTVNPLRLSVSSTANHSRIGVSTTVMQSPARSIQHFKPCLYVAVRLHPAYQVVSNLLSPSSIPRINSCPLDQHLPEPLRQFFSSTAVYAPIRLSCLRDSVSAKSACQSYVDSCTVNSCQLILSRRVYEDRIEFYQRTLPRKVSSSRSTRFDDSLRLKEYRLHQSDKFAPSTFGFSGHVYSLSLLSAKLFRHNQVFSIRHVEPQRLAPRTTRQNPQFVQHIVLPFHVDKPIKVKQWRPASLSVCTSRKFFPRKIRTSYLSFSLISVQIGSTISIVSRLLRHCHFDQPAKLTQLRSLSLLQAPSYQIEPRSFRKSNPPQPIILSPAFLFNSNLSNSAQQSISIQLGYSNFCEQGSLEPIRLHSYISSGARLQTESIRVLNVQFGSPSQSEPNNIMSTGNIRQHQVRSLPLARQLRIAQGHFRTSNKGEACRVCKPIRSRSYYVVSANSVVSHPIISAFHTTSIRFASAFHLIPDTFWLYHTSISSKSSANNVISFPRTLPHLSTSFQRFKQYRFRSRKFSVPSHSLPNRVRIPHKSLYGQVMSAVRFELCRSKQIQSKTDYQNFFIPFLPIF